MSDSTPDRLSPEGIQEADREVLRLVDNTLAALLSRIIVEGPAENDDAVLRQLHWIRRDIAADYRAG